MDAFVLLLGMVSPHGPPFSKVVESTSDGPWIVTHIDQSGMVDDWWQSVPGKLAAPPTLRWESGGGGCGYLSSKYGFVTWSVTAESSAKTPLYRTHTTRETRLGKHISQSGQVRKFYSEETSVTRLTTFDRKRNKQ